MDDSGVPYFRKPHIVELIGKKENLCQLCLDGSQSKAFLIWMFTENRVNYPLVI